MKNNLWVKRILSVGLALIICFGCCTAVLAADAPAAPPDEILIDEVIVFWPDFSKMPPLLVFLIFLPTILTNLPSALYELLREKTGSAFDAVQEFFWEIEAFFENLFDR